MTSFWLCDVSDERWSSALLEMSHDVYHRPDYVGIAAAADGGFAQAAVAAEGGTQVLLPLIRREIHGGSWDVISPYGYPGPVATRGADRTLSTDLLHEIFRHLAELGCVSAFLRMHPGLNADWPKDLVQPSGLLSATDTIALSLDLSEAEALAAMKSGHRYQVRQALKNEYRVVEDLDGEYTLEFARMYREHMAALGAADYYLFNDDYFEAFLSGSGSPGQLWMALKDGEVGAAAIFTVAGDWVEYHLAASNPEHRRFSPGKLLVHAVRMAHTDRGQRWLHLGGGVGGSNDSLLEFKEGFGGRTLTYKTAGLILDPSGYEELVAARGDEVASSNFFPLYRSP